LESLLFLVKGEVPPCSQLAHSLFSPLEAVEAKGRVSYPLTSRKSLQRKNTASSGPVGPLGTLPFRQDPYCKIHDRPYSFFLLTGSLIVPCPPFSCSFRRFFSLPFRKEVLKAPFTLQPSGRTRLDCGTTLFCPSCPHPRAAGLFEALPRSSPWIMY